MDRTGMYPGVMCVRKLPGSLAPNPGAGNVEYAIPSAAGPSDWALFRDPDHVRERDQDRDRVVIDWLS